MLPSFNTFCVRQQKKKTRIKMAPYFPAASCCFWLLSNVFLAVPSWERLEAKLPTAPAPECYHNTLPDDVASSSSLIFYRDTESICPFAQQIWLALEVKNINYVTVLVDTVIEEHSWSSPLRVQWPDGTLQTDALEILERLEKEYPGGEESNGVLNLFPSISAAVDSVRCNIVRFQGVFPRNTQPNPYAPYLIRQKNPQDLSDTSWAPESDHLVTLEETDEVMEEYYQGPFLCGAQITAADIVWAPFLERYAAQLPLVYDSDSDDLTPRSSEYETLKEWYEAMEEQVPAYSCRVMGDKATWERLFQTGVENKLTPDVKLQPFSRPGTTAAIPTKRRTFNTKAVWNQYARTRPHVAESPELECAAYYVRNRATIITQAAADIATMSENEIESALLEVLGALLESGGVDDPSVVSSLSGNARELASYLEERLCVPRDMGALPAAALRTLAAAAPKPRIASR